MGPNPSDGEECWFFDRNEVRGNKKMIKVFINFFFIIGYLTSSNQLLRPLR